MDAPVPDGVIPDDAGPHAAGLAAAGLAVAGPDRVTPDAGIRLELDRMEADLSRVSESLRLLDQDDAEPSRATAWLTNDDR